MPIRPMTLHDHEQLVPLWQPEGMEHSRDYLETILKRNPDTCFVIEDDGRIVAAACGLWNGRHGIVTSVAVSPEARGQGHGAAIVMHTADSMKALGCKRIRLFVKKDNHRAIALYQRLGFEILDDTHYMSLNA